MAALAEMRRRFPWHHIRVGRRGDARCTACGADHAWDKAHGTLRPVPDCSPA